MFLFDWVWSVLAYFGFRKNAKLLLIGLDNAGKSTLLDRLADGRLVQHAPTGRVRCRELTLGHVAFTAYDLGGHRQARSVWKQYFPAVDGIVFMVDSADPDRFQESRAELDDETISEIPVIVLANKTDKKQAVGEDVVVGALGLSVYRTGKEVKKRSQLPGRPLEVFPCSLVKQTGYGDAFRWLAGYVEGQ